MHAYQKKNTIWGKSILSIRNNVTTPTPKYVIKRSLDTDCLTGRVENGFNRADGAYSRRMDVFRTNFSA